VVVIQGKFNPNLAIVLDYSLKLGMTLQGMKKAWQGT